MPKYDPPKWVYYKKAGRIGPGGSMIDSTRENAQEEAHTLALDDLSHEYAVKRRPGGQYEIWRRGPEHGFMHDSEPSFAHRDMTGKHQQMVKMGYRPAGWQYRNKRG